MYPKYRIALSAQRGGFTEKVARELGPVTELGEEGWVENTNHLVIDCSGTSVPRNPDHWRQALDLGKSLGLISMRNEDRSLLEQVVGRPLKPSHKHLFVRRSFGEPERYNFTIVPEFDANADPAKFAEYLQERVFVRSPKPVPPPETINNLWPVNSNFNELFASRKTLITDWQMSNEWPVYQPPTASRLTVDVVGHFYLANGNLGDQDYHVIILTRMSNIWPLTEVGVDLDPQTFCWLEFGYGIKVTPNIAPRTIYSTQPRTNNSPPPPQNWGSLGDYVCCSFGFSPLTQINIIGTRQGSNRQETFELNPTYLEYNNAVSLPGIEHFYVLADESSKTSVFQINMWNVISLSKSEGLMSRTPGSLEELRLNNAGLSTISYMTFPGTNLSTNVVEFTLEVDLFGDVDLVSHTVPSWSASRKRSFAVDLVSATRLQPVTQSK
jgi:hypothetical protein